MVPIAPEESDGPERGGADPLRHAVQVALAIYLLPVIAIVCAIGGASIVLDRASRLATRLGFEGHRAVKPGPLAITRSASRPMLPSDRRRIRVGR
jgi:hypothetical protein